MLASAGTGGVSAPAVVVIWVVLVAAYWAPTIIAPVRKVRGIGQVVIVNFFLGWTLIGWVVALVMAFRHVPAATEAG
jgi:Superinfection immunity protein